MIKKLRQKFILVMMLSLLIVMVILVGAINIVYAHNIRAQADSTIEVLYDNSGSFPDMPKGGGAPSGIPADGKGGGYREGHITPDTKFETSFFMVMLNDDGSVAKINHGFVASVTETDIQSFAETIVASGKTSGSLNYFRYKVFTGDDDGRVIVAVNCYQQLRQERTLLLVSAAAGVLCMAAVFILVLLMSRRVTKPMEESVSKQRRFITDAGHELKTPITIISANTEVLQMQTGENQWLDSIKNQTRRLNHLVKNLLELSKLDEEDYDTVFSDVDLTALVTEVTDSFSVPARAAGKTLTAELAPGIHINGSRDELYKLTSILLDNALKYSNDGGAIKVTLQKGRKTVLTVYNTCPEVDPDQTSRLFERFYRADESRSRQTGGSGIGLSIAKAIAERHKGRISAASSDGKSILFTVTF